MPSVDVLSSWVTWTPLERAAVREVYLHGRSVADTAHRHDVGPAQVGQALQSAHRRIAALVLDPADEDPLVRVSDRSAALLRSVAELPTATWRWDTSDELMAWSDGLYGVYGYPVGAVPPTIGLHQAHKVHEDRAVAERLALDSATACGPVVFPQRIVRTDGTICRVVMRVTREPGPREVLNGRVVVDAAP